MKKYLIFLLYALFAVSCLESNLDDLPEFDEAEFLDLDMEFRFEKKNANNVPVMQVVSIPCTINIDKDNGLISVVPSLPNATGDFTAEIRESVSLSKIIVYAQISRAAKVHPIDNAPKLGTFGNWTKENKYEVVAANGDKKVWTIKIEPWKVVDNS